MSALSLKKGVEKGIISPKEIERFAILILASGKIPEVRVS